MPFLSVAGSGVVEGTPPQSDAIAILELSVVKGFITLPTRLPSTPTLYGLLVSGDRSDFEKVELLEKYLIEAIVKSNLKN
jgi:hypothetical protein